ncbi:DUF4859 domain-containing protein [Zunongwangia sp.]|uniref:DUF4859 domain-containing protein n=1 Tax=Zunongwangia sp. TaxID=1965325 RepID=UPI003AA881BB
MKKVNTLIYLSFLCLFVVGCSSGNNDFEEETDAISTGEDTTPENSSETNLEIYKPNEFSSMDFNDNSSTWSYQRSQESEHFIVFWDAQYADENPGSENIPEAYRVDIEDLLEKAEQFYHLNINELGFAKLESGTSYLNQYKLMIFLYYQDEWLATGSGYDDVIGALWVSPNTAQPVGHTIAHEIGHSFQYQVFADLKNGHGFRYGFGGNGGNSFWEQTAQWQGFQSYPEQIFTTEDFNVYVQNYNKHIHHEDYRYASYFINYYWIALHGEEFIGKLWREAKEPEDPVQAYMRLTRSSISDFNDEIYEAATRFVTWDFDELRDLGKDYIGQQKYEYTTLNDGSHKVTPKFAPQTTGYNVIPLNVPQENTTISVGFTGLPNEAGFNTVDVSIAGWRYGFVALQKDGSRVYGEMNQGLSNMVDFVIPANCEKLWLVVTGAPTEYSPHAWDDDNSNDEEWPYKVNFSGTDILGIVTIPEDGEHTSVNLEYEVSFPADSQEYSGITKTIAVNAIAEAFLLQPIEITQKVGNEIAFYAVENSNELISETTANGYGHWFTANGQVINWGEGAVLFSEFDPTDFSFKIGQYPGKVKAGESYSFTQALVYDYQLNKSVQATITFHVTIE